MQNARENPIAAAVAAVDGAAGQANAENLLDIDFDGAVPASSANAGASGLEGLAGTPQRIASPAAGPPKSNSMDDMMGLFDQPAPAQQSGNGIVNGFAGMDLGGTSQSPQPQTQGQDKKTTEDLLGMF